MKDNLNKMEPIDYESEFDHELASWANNHNGWAKAKAANRRQAKAQHKRLIEKEIDMQTDEDYR